MVPVSGGLCPRGEDMTTRNTRRVVTLRSSAGTGSTYTTTVNKQNDPDRLRLRKYDAKLGRMVEFREER